MPTRFTFGEQFVSSLEEGRRQRENERAQRALEEFRIDQLQQAADLASQQRALTRSESAKDRIHSSRQTRANQRFQSDLQDDQQGFLSDQAAAEARREQERFEDTTVEIGELDPFYRNQFGEEMHDIRVNPANFKQDPMDPYQRWRMGIEMDELERQNESFKILYEEAARNALVDQGIGRSEPLDPQDLHAFSVAETLSERDQSVPANVSLKEDAKRRAADALGSINQQQALLAASIGNMERVLERGGNMNPQELVRLWQPVLDTMLNTAEATKRNYEALSPTTWQQIRGKDRGRFEIDGRTVDLDAKRAELREWLHAAQNTITKARSIGTKLGVMQEYDSVRQTMDALLNNVLVGLEEGDLDAEQSLSGFTKIQAELGKQGRANQ